MDLKEYPACGPFSMGWKKNKSQVPALLLGATWADPGRREQSEGIAAGQMRGAQEAGPAVQ